MLTNHTMPACLGDFSSFLCLDIFHLTESCSWVTILWSRHGSVSHRSTRTCCHTGPSDPKGLTCAVVLGRMMVLFVFYEGLEKSG